MNLRASLPKQSEIEEFLGREFFPKYPYTLPLKDAVDMVQIEFDVADEARALPIPNGHGCSFEGGTVLECLTHFAILRLQEKGYVVRTSKNHFKYTGKKWINQVPVRDVNECLLGFKILKDHPVEKVCTLLLSRWSEDTVLAARAKWVLTSGSAVIG